MKYSVKILKQHLSDLRSISENDVPSEQLHSLRSQKDDLEKAIIILNRQGCL